MLVGEIPPFASTCYKVLCDGAVLWHTMLWHTIAGRDGLNYTDPS